MQKLMSCIIYLVLIGVLFFIVGRILPRKWFCYDRFPYRSFPFEKNGKIYCRLAIKKWKDKVPDMSMIVPELIPSKKIPKMLTAEQAESMLIETCIAEFIHTSLCIFAVRCISLWKGLGGWIIFIIYVAGNIPFNLIQRYNRPRLARIAQELKQKERRNYGKRKSISDENLKNISTVGE